MDQSIKKVISPALKIKVAIEALKEAETPGQLASKYSVHPIQIGIWKKTAREAIEKFFNSGVRGKTDPVKEKEEFIQELFNQIGQQKVEIDFLKKKVGLIS